MAKKSNNTSLPTIKQVEKYEMLTELTGALYIEMKEFSKKKPDEPLNKFKVKNVNRVLEQVKDVLSLQPTSAFLDLLDDETLPSNSDAILIIAQYKAALQRFKDDFWKYDQWDESDWRWSTKENPVK